METAIIVNYKDGNIQHIGFVKSIKAGEQYITFNYENPYVVKGEIMLELSKIKSIEFRVNEDGNSTK